MAASDLMPWPGPSDPDRVTVGRSGREKGLVWTNQIVMAPYRVAARATSVPQKFMIFLLKINFDFRPNFSSDATSERPAGL